MLINCAITVQLIYIVFEYTNSSFIPNYSCSIYLGNDIVGRSDFTDVQAGFHYDENRMKIFCHALSKMDPMSRKYSYFQTFFFTNSWSFDNTESIFIHLPLHRNKHSVMNNNSLIY